MGVRSTIDLVSPLPIELACGLAAAVIALLLVVRWALGPPAGIARRWELLGIRGLIVVTLLAVLANPVRVDESPGVIERPKVFYLLDASESMALGNDGSRFDEAVGMIRDAGRLMPIASQPQLGIYRFGRRLEAIESAASLDAKPALRPDDGDTQLASALRQLPGRFGSTPPASVVLFSDGRAREPAGVEEIARRYAEMKVPIHVVPLGDTSRSGDVAIVNMIVPTRVRKYSQVTAQIFVRSYGYDRRRSELRLSALGEDGRVERELNHVPITLRTGIQSFPLTFRTEMRSVRVQASITPQPGEVSEQNNVVTAETQIDRTKIRVLYVEGLGSGPGNVSSARQLIQALTADPDVECNGLVTIAGPGKFRSITTGYGAAFPVTSAEFFAFDAIILSNVARRSLSDQQVAWIETWIRERGGGLCMVGGPQSFASGGWRGTAVEEMLPVVMLPDGDDWTGQGGLRVQPVSSPSLHPVWNLVADQRQNRAILASFPACAGVNRILREKTTAQVLAVTERFQTAQGPMPLIAAGPYGNGRTLAMAIPISGPWAANLVRSWGQGDNRYYQKLWRNVVYWLTENSAIGRRRLLATTDKILYRPGETIALEATAYDEGANRTMGYRIDVMIEPQSAILDLDSDYCALSWPNELPRTSGAEGPLIAWGEEFELPARADQKGFGLKLPISEDPAAGAASQPLRIEVSAYEDYALVDSTSIDVQVLDDPFEQQNPLPDPELLHRVARLAGGSVVSDAEALAAMIRDLPTKVGPPLVDKTPIWSRWWLLLSLLALLTVEWAWRRSLGLA